MDVSVKGEPSEVAEAMDATLYEDVMENGIKMETIEVDDSIPPTYEPSCNSRPPGGSITTPRRGNTKLMTINVRRTLQGIVVTPIHSARTMWSHQAASRIPASGSVKRFTVVVPRRTPYDERFEQPSGKYTERSVGLVQANIGTSSAAIPLNSEEACAEGSDEQPEVMRDVLPTSTKNDDTTATSDLAVEAGSSQKLSDNAGTSAAEKMSRNSYSLEKKLKAIATVKRLNNIDKASQLEDVPRTCLQKWLANEQRLKDASESRGKDTKKLTPDRPVKLRELDDGLAEWIKERRNKKQKITSKLIKHEAARRLRKIPSGTSLLKLSAGWQASFLRRHLPEDQPEVPCDELPTTTSTEQDEMTATFSLAVEAGPSPANIGTSRAPIALDSEESSAEGSTEQPEVTRDELPTSAKKGDTTIDASMMAKLEVETASDAPSAEVVKSECAEDQHNYARVKSECHSVEANEEANGMEVPEQEQVVAPNPDVDQAELTESDNGHDGDDELSFDNSSDPDSARSDPDGDSSDPGSDSSYPGSDSSDSSSSESSVSSVEEEEQADNESSAYEPDISSSSSSSSSAFDSSSDDDLTDYAGFTDAYYNVYPCRFTR